MSARVQSAPSLRLIVRGDGLVTFFVLTMVTSALLRLPVAFLGLDVSEGLPWLLDVLSITALGPAAVAIMLTARQGGRPAVRALLRRVLPVGGNPLWYVAAFLMPVAMAYGTELVAVTTGANSPRSWLPTSWGLAAWLFVWQMCVITAGEEIGWRGFAFPRLVDRHGSLGASLVLGPLWALWHVPLFLSAGNAVGDNLLVMLLTMTAKSVVMGLFVLRTGSILPAMLFHTANNIVAFTVPFHAGLIGTLVCVGVAAASVIWLPRPRLGGKRARAVAADRPTLRRGRQDAPGVA